MVQVFPENISLNFLGHIAENVTAFSGFRQAAYNADTFRNSMVQHLPTMAISAVAAARSGGANFLMNIARQGAQTWQDWLVSHSAFGNANASNLIFADDVQFSIGIKSVSREALRTIDRYFSMYGYNVQAMHKPLYYYKNRGDRKCVYIKTRDVEIHGQIPKYALEYISNLFNNGVRIWTNEANIGNYD